MTDFLLDKSHPAYREHRSQLLATIDFSDQPLIIRIQKRTKKRTDKQNRYYWGVVLAYVADETGISVLLLHLIFKEEFIPWVVFTDDFNLTTTDLTTVQMNEYIELIRNFALTFLHVEIPDPYSVIR